MSIDLKYWIYIDSKIRVTSSNFPHLQRIGSIYLDWDFHSWLENVVAVSYVDHTYTEDISEIWEISFIVVDASFFVNIFEDGFSIHAIKYERIGDYIDINEEISISTMEREIYKIKFNLTGYTYKQLVSIVFDEFIQREKFIPDYHVVRYIQSNAKVPAIDIGRVLAEIRNIFAIMDRENIDEAHFLTFRVIRWKYDPRKKPFFVVTDW